MAILKAKDVAKMNKEEIKSKLKDLNFELVKSNVTANKSKSKMKELKRARARLLTFSRNAMEAKKK